MKKQNSFKLIDLVIYFNIFIFIGSGIFGLETSLTMSVIFFVLSFLNIVFMILTIKLRLNYNKNLISKIKIELQAETKMSQENKANYNHAKQILLESRIESEILNKIPNVKVIRNAYVPRTDGTRTEIDLIAICSQGIFIIESKNITGRIKGTWKQDKLLIEHPGGKTYSLMNPINQNTQHYYSLKSFLGIKTDIYRSVIVFSDLTYINSYKDVPYFTQICYLHNLIYSMNKLSKRYNTTLEDYMVVSIYENLLKLVEKNDEIEKKHVERLTSK
jgi:hypothetical protein